MTWNWSWEVVLLLAAFACFAFAAFGKESKLLSLIPTGLALWVVVVLLNAAGIQ